MFDLSDAYRALELEPGASAAEIREAWRDLATVWHPDRFPDNERLRRKAEERLKRINLAYERLRSANGMAADPSPHGYRSASDVEVDPWEVLRDGVRAWNLFRQKYSDVRPAFPGAQLARRAFEGIDFRECDLGRADLSGADLYKANLSRSTLRRANLSGADLNRAIALAADLTEANLSEANLASADRRGAALVRATFTGTNLVGARLEGADLGGAVGLTLRQLESAEIDAATRLPGKLG